MDHPHVLSYARYAVCRCLNRNLRIPTYDRLNTFPRLHKLSQLRRDPHLLAWFRFLSQQYPSPGNRTRQLHLLTVRRLLRDLANQDHPVTPDLIRHEDFPPPDHYLPKPLPLDEDQQLQQQLRLADTLEVNALCLMRATGIRISECINLPLDCLQQISEQQVTLHVPLGKLHSQRLVPVDEETQRVVARMVELGAVTPIPEVPSFLTASLLATCDLVQGAARHLSRNGPDCRLHWSGQLAPTTALFRVPDYYRVILFLPFFPPSYPHRVGIVWLLQPFKRERNQL